MELSIIGNIKDLLNPPELTKNIYSSPIPSNVHIKRIDLGGKSHEGPFKGAQDFIVENGTPILATLDGTVVEVIDSNEKYGPTEDFKDYLNYVTIRHANGEYSQPAHLEKGSAKVKVGDTVTTGQEIGLTGNSGWMTEPHLHLLIFRLDNNPAGFKGLKIRFK